MSLIEELLKDVETSDTDEQLRVICDKIMDEEIGDLKEYNGPMNPNIFLSLLAFEGTKDYFYVCLERESVGKYFIGVWAKNSAIVDAPNKRVESHPVKQTSTDKIMQEYAAKLNFIRGG